MKKKTLLIILNIILLIMLVIFLLRLVNNSNEAELPVSENIEKVIVPEDSSEVIQKKGATPSENVIYGTG